MKRIEGKEGGVGGWKERRKLVRHGSRRDKQVKRAVTIAAIIMLWLCTIKPMHTNYHSNINRLSATLDVHHVLSCRGSICCLENSGRNAI